MIPDLPPDLRSALDQLAHGKSRREFAQRAEAISQRYRSSAGSREAVRNSDDALAYAFTRLPATYAATAAALAAAQDVWPEFSPHSLIDAGAGPGTAAWASVEQFPALTDVRLIDESSHLRALALACLQASDAPALRNATYDQGDILATAGGGRADLVIASYVIGELAPDRLLRLADALWSAAAGMLVVIEPGTPSGFSRIRALRAHLIAQGAHVVAPCPHDRACPIVDPDWCHFAQRLNRSRAHRQVKGAELSFEDEKFSYVALAREPLAREPLARERPPGFGARVLAHPRVNKAEVSAKLCTPAGIVAATAARREPAGYKAQKAWRWGDAVDWPSGRQDREIEDSRG
jgi:ribosomal protein RSM22 (predicted rRNA methylase)